MDYLSSNGLGADLKALVTGSNGFMASHLVETLNGHRGVSEWVGTSRKKGTSIESLRPNSNVYCSVDNEAAVESLFKVYQPDVIFHFAAEQGNTYKAFQNNVLSTMYLLKYAPQGVRFVYASSSTVYGDGADKGAWCDTDFNRCVEFENPVPTSLYGASKLAGEVLVQAHTFSSKINGVSLRYVATVGARANHGATRHIVDKLRSEAPELELFGEFPGSIKPYLHVNDAVSAAIFFGLEDGAKELGVVNVSPSDEISIDTLSHIIMKTMGISKPKRWSPDKMPEGDNKVVRLANYKLKHFLHFKFKYPNSESAVIAATQESQA
jgi:nucleoside-diphosphate-sugar epimerase